MIQRILIVVDPQAPLATAAALSWGLAVAQARSAELLLCSPLPTYTLPLADVPQTATVSPEEFDREARGAAQQALQAAQHQATALGVMSQSLVSTADDRVRGLLDTAERRRCQLIVAGTDGSNALMRLLSGSLIPGLITASPLPLLIVSHPRAGPAAEPLRLRRLLVAVEDREGAGAAVDAGLSLAREHGAELVLAHPFVGDWLPALDTSALAGAAAEPVTEALRQRATQRLEHALAAARQAGLGARGLVLDSGPTGHRLAALADEAGCELIVVAHEGHNAVLRLLSGSPMPGLVTAAAVPVLVCRDRAA